MELLLNLFWSLLAVPAYWVWRRQDRTFDSLRRFLTLGCVLVVLFPVISATDDLHAIRQEVEESSSTKRALKHAAIDRSSAQIHLDAPPAHVTLFFVVRLCKVVGGTAIVEQFANPAGLEPDSLPSRAPPFSLA
jgi:hypothetical protein